MKQKGLIFLTSPMLRSVSKIFIGAGTVLSKMFPHMELALKQSGVAEDYDLNSRTYFSLAITISLLLMLLTYTAVYLIMAQGGKNDARIAFILGIIVALVFIVYMMIYPTSIVNKRVKYVERNLLFALRSILIQIRSGVPIFNSFISIANGDYGPISTEMRNLVEKVNAGQPMVETLEELAIRNPSLYFRRALWQMVNGIKSGSNIGDNISNIITSLSKEQLVEVRKYMSTLNPLAMMYMMVAVIMPSLSITMLIILSSLPGTEAIAQERTFWVMLVVFSVLQFIFLGIIRSRRPNLIGG